MQHIVIDDTVGERGDAEIINIIKNKPELKPFFIAEAKTEVPIAGYINKKIVTRRIDRLLLNHDTKEITIIDYKTDTDKNAFIIEYKKQINEYGELLSSAYPGYKINGYILWIQDWTLDRII